jgi:hypothetical protein
MLAHQSLFFRFVPPSHIRMQVQRSCFTYHPPTVQELTEKQNPSLRKLVFSATVKKAIKERLLHLGIDHFSVYGDVDSLATTVKSNFDLGTSK